MNQNTDKKVLKLLISCYTIQKWKLEPDVFLWAAKTRGFDVFGFIAHNYNNELKAEATHTFSSMNSLLSIIQS